MGHLTWISVVPLVNFEGVTPKVIGFLYFLAGPRAAEIHMTIVHMMQWVEMGKCAGCK